MKKHEGLILLLIFATLPCAAQTLKRYDKFDHKFINPSRWDYAFCFSGSGIELECVREIRDGQLHLGHRGFGLTNSDSGQQNGGAGVGFANSQTISTITTDLVVRSVLEVPCAANPSYGTSAGIWGTFFNSGSGDPNDDVGAQFGVTRFSSDPTGQLTVRGQTFHAGVYSDFFTIGTVAIGTPITITLSWDQPNHQFVISFTNRVTKVTTRGTMPYAFSDWTPVAGPAKTLGANGWASNCTANPTSNYVDALFGNVYVGYQPAVSFSTEPSDTSYSSGACTTFGRPCNPKASTCCPGSSCVFHGGSTRVGYMCMLRATNENIIDRSELTESLR